MGWCYEHVDGSISDFLSRTYFKYSPFSIVRRNELYAAHTHNNVTYAVVWLLHYQPNAWNNFGYKDMDESCGPNAANCPIKILNLLTPINRREEYAFNWRQKCWLRALDKRRGRKGNIDSDFKYLTKGIENLETKEEIIVPLKSVLQHRGYDNNEILVCMSNVWGFKLLC